MRVKMLGVILGAAAGVAVLLVGMSVIDNREEPTSEVGVIETGGERVRAGALADSPLGRLVAHAGLGTPAPTDRARWDAWADARVRLGEVRSDDLATGFWNRMIARRWAAATAMPPGTIEALVAVIRLAPLAWRRLTAREQRVAGRRYAARPPADATLLTGSRRVSRPSIRLPAGPLTDRLFERRDRIPVRVEICVTQDGQPREAHVVEGTGIPEVDEVIARQLLAGHYRPLVRDGRRVEYCERTTVVLGSS